jgi:hypothetical protein
VIQVSNQIRQVNAPEGLADIITDSPFAYEIRFYLPSQVSSVTNGYGLYYLLGSPSPFVTWTIQNPDASTNVFNRLSITETRGGVGNTYSYAYTAATGTWVIDYPGGLREDQVVSTINTNTTSGYGYTRTVVATTSLPGGSVQSKTERVYQNLGGSRAYNNQEHLVQETLSPDTAPKTTTYAYDAGYMGNGTFQPLRIVVHPDGSWQYYQYGFDFGDPGSLPNGKLRVYGAYSGLGDTPVPVSFHGSWPTILGNYRYTQYSYDPLSGSGDDGTLEPYSPRTITTDQQDASAGYLPVSLEYRVFLPGETHAIRCQTSSAVWSDTNNLVTITKYFTNGPNVNRVQSVQNPDGTMVLYQYAQAGDGSQTNTVWSGQPNSGGTSIIDGTMDVTVIGPVGQMVSHTVSDIVSGGTVLQKDLFSSYDSFNRPQQVSHLDNTTEITHYDCCETDYAVDRDSVTNFYGYDAMKRPITSTRLGITTTSVLGPLGRVVATIRTGSDNSQVTLGQSQYDLAGRLVAETNALLGVTRYGEGTDPVTGGLVRTNTYADGGTRLEWYYLDGSLKQVTGTAVHPVQYFSGLDNDGPFTTEIKVASGGGTNEWTKTSSDFLGRPYKTLYADNASSQSYYNNQGQLWKEIDPIGVGHNY